MIIDNPLNICECFEGLGMCGASDLGSLHLFCMVIPARHASSLPCSGVCASLLQQKKHDSYFLFACVSVSWFVSESFCFDIAVYMCVSLNMFLSSNVCECL